MDQISLNVYLLKKGRNPFKEIELDGFKNVFSVPIGNDQMAPLYFKITGGEPEWLMKLKDISAYRHDIGGSKSPQAILLVRSNQRWFAITFGHAWQRVANKDVVADFGTRCVLNMARPDALVSIRRDRIASDSIQAIEQIPDSDGIHRFGMDIEQDMLRGVKARIDKSIGFGDTVVGGDSFKGTLDLKKDTILNFCKRALSFYGRKTLSSNFKWFDKIESESDDQKIYELERRLAKALSLGVRSIALTVPTLLSWDEYDTFSFRPTKRGHLPVSEPLDALHWRRAHAGPRVTPASIQESHLYAYKSGSYHLVSKWPLRKCINATIKLHDAIYVTQSGAWYRVAKDFIEETKNAISAIQVDKIKYPALSSRENETLYNKRVGQDFPSRFFYLDKRLVHVVGRNYIEVCDLLRFDGALICVKSWGGRSQDISHLFQQAIVSGQLISSHQPYIDGVSKVITRPGFNAIWNTEAAKKSGATFVLATLRGVAKEQLPFFAQVAMVSCVRNLTQMRFDVKYATIA